MNSCLKYWIWLSSLMQITPRRKLQLIEYFGDPAYIWESTEAELRASNICTPRMLSVLLDRQNRKNAEKLMEEVFKSDAEVITIKDDIYPENLKYIADPPVALYIKGTLRKDEVYIAVVGSRKASSYGLETAQRLSWELAANGVTIVSGMARGIDSKAHWGALSGGGRTIAVLGCGIDIIYPPENAELMEKICKLGAIISEYAPGTPPIAVNFPARNRIISGLSQGVAVIEASEKSGSLITAEYALDQGREVYAVPGNINSFNSTGTNKLLKDGAKLVTNGGDILEDLKIGYNFKSAYTKEKKLSGALLKGNEKTIAMRLLDGPAHIDAIARDCGISVQLAGSVLVMLELSGFVEHLPGRYYKLAE